MKVVELDKPMIWTPADKPVLFDWLWRHMRSQVLSPDDADVRLTYKVQLVALTHWPPPDNAADEDMPAIAKANGFKLLDKGPFRQFWPVYNLPGVALDPVQDVFGKVQGGYLPGETLYYLVAGKVWAYLLKAPTLASGDATDEIVASCKF